MTKLIKNVASRINEMTHCIGKHLQLISTKHALKSAMGAYLIKMTDRYLVLYYISMLNLEFVQKVYPRGFLRIISKISYLLLLLVFDVRARCLFSFKSRFLLCIKFSCLKTRLKPSPQLRRDW